ncbi:MAG: SCO family protein [Marinilabiliales bacterium]|nr:MAG: SCO family protein [Marinilabiliales bacterium]
MRKITTIVVFLTLLFTFELKSQNPINPDIVEIGWLEHLGDTIPLDLVFNSEVNKQVTLRELIDKPTVLSFVYFNCPGVCNPLQESISRVAEKVDMELGKDYQILTISFDVTDTPEKAQKKKSNFIDNIVKEKAAHWMYLTGDQENIDAITEAVGFRYKETGLDFAHPSGIILISPDGKITRYLYGLDFLPFDLKMAIIEAQQGIPRPTISKVLQYCFNYDPQGQTYTLSVTRVAGTVIMFIAVLVFIGLIIGKRRSAKKEN